MPKPTFILKTDYLTYFREMGLSKAEIGALMLAIFEYHESGAVPTARDLGGTLFAAFMMIKVDLDKNAEKYSKKCRVLAGNRGGGNQQKSTDIGHGNDSDYDSDGDNDSDYDNDCAAACGGGSKVAAAAERSGIRTLYTELIGKWSANVEKRLFSYGLPPEDIRYAINEAAENNVPKLSYIAKILETKKEGGQRPAQRGAGGPPRLDPQAVEEMRRRISAEK